MASRNKVEFIGVVSAPPTIEVEGDLTFAILAVDTVERVTGPGGERQEIKETHEIQFSGAVAQNIAKFVKPHALVLIEGSLTSELFTDSAGVPRVAAIILGKTIQMLGRPAEDAPAVTVKSPTPASTTSVSSATASSTARPTVAAAHSPATTGKPAGTQAPVAPVASPAVAAAATPVRKWARGASAAA